MNESELRAQLERHHKDSYGWALSCCLRNPEDADSVLQTVYVKVLAGKARFDGRAAFKTWLFSVIRKTAADHRRRRALRRFRLIRYIDSAQSVAIGQNPETAVYYSEVQRLFQRALSRLPDRQRETLQLAFYHDLSLAEAADVMGISIGAARTHYERGKKALRDWLVNDRGFDEARSGKRETQRPIPGPEARR
jgi:RNA polymerase sigma-70 factor (ECF subfamily)